MSVRVNLLLPDERHLYTAVGRPFMIKLAVGAGGSLLLIFCALALFNLHTVVGGLGSAKDRWSEIEEAHGKALLVKKEVDEYAGLESELDGWSNSRVDWLDPLKELQYMVPTNVQLTALNVSSRTTAIRGKPVPGANKEKGSAPPSQMARVFSVRLDGKARGSMADQVVTRFVDELRQAPTMKPWLKSLGLQGLQRAASRGSDSDEWIFRIEAESSERIMK